MSEKISDCGNGWYAFHCPGCKYDHSFISGGENPNRPQWKFNFDFEKPTFSPSLLINRSDASKRCHSFVQNGRIQFLEDCFHELKGQTVELPEWDSDKE